MNRAGAGVAAALALAALAAPVSVGAAEAAAAPARCQPAGVGVDSFCEVAGLRLHYVDWGGEGPPIVLLTGLGDSARIFDGFAPLLAQGHRVIAATRRGYGLSAAPPDGDYSNAALVRDVLGLMDALGFPRASFVGHSIAGGELESLGEGHADRVGRLVYLDAAYDRSGVLALMTKMPPLPALDAGSRRDFPSLVAWYQSALGVPSEAIAHNLEATFVPGDGGWVPRTPASVGQAVLAGDIAEAPHWDAIPVPSLAVYGSKDIADQVPPTASAAQRQSFVEWSLRMLRPWMLRQQADFIERSPCGVAVERPRSTHYLFLEKPELTASTVLSFLSAVDPCRWEPARR